MINTIFRWQRQMNDGGCQNPPGRPARVLFLKPVILLHPSAERFCMLLCLMHCIPNAHEEVKRELYHSGYLCLQVESVSLLFRPCLV